MSDVNKDYLTEEYPHSVDDRAAAVEQRPTFFDFDDPYGDDPMIYLKEGWHGLGSLTELAFTSGGSIVGSGTSLQFTSNVEITGSLTVGGDEITIQTSLTDSTDDRLMKVGAFGLGETGIVSDISNIDDVDVAVGNYRWSSSTSGTLPPVTGGGTAGVVVVFRRFSSNDFVQLAFPRNEERIFFRECVGDSFGSWKEVFTGDEDDTAWTTVTSLDNGWTGTVKYIKRAGWVTVIADGLDGSSATDNDVLESLPSGYRPDENTFFEYTESNTFHGRGRVNTDGVIRCYEVSGTNVAGAITYPVL